MAGALLALWSLFAPLPSFLLDLFSCVALATGASALSSPISSLPTLLVSLAVFRVGLGLALLRGALSGDVGLAASVGASLPGAAGLFLVASAALALGLFLAKAASRAAEVSARFALDSLPGAQAAIDAEPRSIDPLHASHAREQLLADTRWKGSADGAAKLLSGDAILAPIFGALAALAPMLQGRDLALSSGVGVALLLLAAALPPAAALSFGVVSSDSQERPSGALLGALSMVPLLFAPQVSLVAPLLVFVLCALLFWWSPPTKKTYELTLRIPPSKKNSWRAFQQNAVLGFALPSIQEINADDDNFTLQSRHQIIATSSSLEEIFVEAAPTIFSLEDAQKIIQTIKAQSPVSAALIQAPLPVLYQAMKQTLAEHLPLEPKLLAEAFSTLPVNATKEEAIEKIRQPLRAVLLRQLGAPPTLALRLSGAIEDELRARRSLDAEAVAPLKEQQQELDATHEGKIKVVLCHRDARAEIALLLKRKSWLFFSPDELPAEIEIDFLGELG